MQFIHSVLTFNEILTVSLLSWFVAQVLKTIINFVLLGRFQLERAKGERIRLEVEIGEAFSAWPGELVRVQRSGWDRNGLYRVAQSTVGMDSRGYWTRLELAPPDFVV